MTCVSVQNYCARWLWVNYFQGLELILTVRGSRPVLKGPQICSTTASEMCDFNICAFLCMLCSGRYSCNSKKKEKKKKNFHTIFQGTNVTYCIGLSLETSKLIQ